MKEFKVREEYIKLGQLLKATGLVDSGLEAKDVILTGEVFVNNESEIRRGRKLYKGDKIIALGEEIIIV